MSTVAIVQARMGSTRLPGKVLLDLNGATMLERVVTRVGRAKTVDAVVVATSTLPADEAIVDEGNRLGVQTYRGSESDVLDRYYRAAQSAEATAVVRITSDCPLIDPDVIDAVVRLLDDGGDYASNVLDPRTFPRGLDTEAMPMTALETAWNEARMPAEREHVTPFLYSHPERFRLRPLYNTLDCSHHRWTVDTPEDLELVRHLYRAFGHGRFSWAEALALIEAHPDWTALNAHVEQKLV